MKHSFLLLILVLVVTQLSAQQGFQISKPEPSLSNNTLTIRYDITGCRNTDMISINLIILNSKGDTLKPSALTGDIGLQVNCGSGKTILWNIAADKININDDIQIYVTGNTPPPSARKTPAVPSVNISRGKIILSSALLPGLGQMKAAGKPAYLVLSGIVYGSAGAAGFLASRLADQRDAYLAATGDDREVLYNKWQSNYNMARYLAVGAAGVWAANIVWAAVIPVTSTRNKNLGIGFSSSGRDEFLVSAKLKF